MYGCILVKSLAKFVLGNNKVIYRSKDENLPDFSKDLGPGGEVFFDVSAKTYVSNVLLTILIRFSSLTCYPKMAQQHSQLQLSLDQVSTLTVLY